MNIVLGAGAGWCLSFRLICSLWLQASWLAACLSPRVLLACLTVDLMSLIIARQLLSKVNCSLYGTPAAVAPPPDYTLPAYDAARADLLALGRRLRATAQEFNVHTGSLPFEPSPPGLPKPRPKSTT